MAVEQYINNGVTTLNGAINNSVTSVVVTDGSVFPSTGDFRIKIEDEIMLCTSRATNTLTVTRGAESTTAASHADTLAVKFALTKASLLKLTEDGCGYGLYSAMPAAGRAGRLYYCSDDRQVYRDNGSTWDVVDKGPRSVYYPPFVPGTYDDEFDDASFSGWTLVNSGSTLATNTESNDCLSISLPGGDTSARLQAYMKTYSPSTNDIIEICFRHHGLNQNYNMFGLIMANGNTYGAGSQVVFRYSPAEGQIQRGGFTNYNTQVAPTTFSQSGREINGVMFMRLKYEGSNNWSIYVSADGISWIQIGSSFSVTLTPTHIGFFCTTWGGAAPYNFSVLYFKKTT